MTTNRPAIKVLPGVPGMEGRTVDDNRVPYPDSTQDFVKSARLLGYDVVFTEPKEDRRYVGFKALETWLPILEFARDLVIGVEGGLLVELMKSYLWPDYADGVAHDELPSGVSSDPGPPQPLDAPTAPTLLHVDWRVMDGEREERFRADGAADAVLEALAKFEEGLRDR